jgi:hypothetical protein
MYPSSRYIPRPAYVTRAYLCDGIEIIGKLGSVG